jgi:Sec-independent protein translocase protein TatA
MDFLGIGPAELILIFLVIILVIGPKDIGKTARSIGRFLNRLYKSDEWRTITQASKTIRTLPNRLAREAELEELEEVKDSLEETKKDLEDTKKGLEKTKQELDEDIKTIGEAKKELAQETKAIDEDMKSWVTPPEKTEIPADTPVSQEKPKVTAQEAHEIQESQEISKKAAQETPESQESKDE